MADGGGPLYGTLTLNADGSYTYAAGSSFRGVDRFRYVANGGGPDSAAATVVVTAEGTTYAPPASQNAPPAAPAAFPATLAGVWGSIVQAKMRLIDLGVALADAGSAAKALGSGPDPASDSDVGSALALVDQVTAATDRASAAYGAYLAQQRTAFSVAGAYMKGVWYTSDDDRKAAAAVQALPTTVLGLTPDRTQLDELNLSLANFDAGATWMLADNTFAVEAATKTHDALETAVAAGGASGIVMAGAKLATEQGCAQLAVYVARQLAGAVASSGVSLAATQLAEAAGVSPDAVRIGADCVQVWFLFKAARAEQRAKALEEAATGRIINTKAASTLANFNNQVGQATDGVLGGYVKADGTVDFVPFTRNGLNGHTAAQLAGAIPKNAIGGFSVIIQDGQIARWNFLSALNGDEPTLSLEYQQQIKAALSSVTIAKF